MAANRAMPAFRSTPRSPVAAGADNPDMTELP